MTRLKNDGEPAVEVQDGLDGRDLTPLRRAEIEEAKARMREIGEMGGEEPRADEPKERAAAVPNEAGRGGVDWKLVLARMMEAYSVGTKKELAGVFGVSQALVGGWAQKAPGFSYLEKVVVEKKVSWDWLLTGNDGVRPEGCAAGIAGKTGEAAKTPADPVCEVLERIDAAFREFLELAETSRTERPVRIASGLARGVVAVLWDMADAYYAERKRRGTGAGEGEA